MNKASVFCPKPRRAGLVINNPMSNSRAHMSYQAEIVDLRAGAELLDIILKKEDSGAEQTATQLASSPPFFSGSPPSRAMNPLIQDARFGHEILTSSPSPLSFPSPSSSSSPSSSACSRMNFGQKLASVRIEGFDCLNRDRQNSRIPSVA